MNRRTIHAWTLAIVAFALCVCGAAFAQAEPDDVLTDEDRADLAWFAALGFDDTKDLPLVQLTGPHGLDVVGFLVEPPDERIRLIGLGLSRIDVAASPAGTEEAKRVVVEALRAVELATDWLTGGGFPSTARHRWHGDASLQTHVLVLADHLHRSDPAVTHTSSAGCWLTLGRAGAIIDIRAVRHRPRTCRSVREWVRTWPRSSSLASSWH